jgi:hypothetical protein
VGELSVIIFLVELVLTELIFLTELLLTALIFLTELALVALSFLAQPFVLHHANTESNIILPGEFGWGCQEMKCGELETTALPFRFLGYPDFP